MLRGTATGNSPFQQGTLRFRIVSVFDEARTIAYRVCGILSIVILLGVLGDFPVNPSLDGDQRPAGIGVLNTQHAIVLERGLLRLRNFSQPLKTRQTLVPVVSCDRVKDPNGLRFCGSVLPVRGVAYSIHLTVSTGTRSPPIPQSPYFI